MKCELFKTQEHRCLNEEQRDCLSKLDLKYPNNADNTDNYKKNKKVKKDKEAKYLGLSLSGQVGYFIGAKWLKENEIALIVDPKVKDLDYLKMFMECFNNPVTSKDILDIYGIDFTKPEIPIPSNSFELTPLIIIHFLYLVKKIVKKGLKCDYIWVENNLNSKIKGKILINQTIKQNVIKSRPDRTYCKYQEYSQNCLENKLIKKTLNFVFTYLKTHYRNNKELLNLFYYNYTAFSNISDNVDVNKIKSIRTNILFKEYNETLKIAKIILRRFAFSIKNTEKKEEKYPPFYIDMTLLFERYVYSKLFKVCRNNIKFQVHGEYGSVDFLNVDDKTIIDTKYKTYYNENFTGQKQWKRDKIAKDIRQLSGYSRDREILKKMNIDITDADFCLDCVIIYPNKKAETEIAKYEHLKQKNNKIQQFNKFFKYGIRLPEKQRNADKV